MKKCPICNSSNINIYTKVKEWKINKCSNCGIIYTVTDSKKYNISKIFYNDEYVSSYNSREKELKDRFRRHLAKIENYKQGGKLLDIGCGLGFFIYMAETSGNYSWRTTGLELNKKLINRALRTVQRRIIQGKISKIPFRDMSFDCVTCFDVLEHDSDFLKNLLEIKRVLKKKGILVIQCPNAISTMAFLTRDHWDWWAPPDHVLHFPFNFLVRYLNQNDFEVLEKFTYEKPKDFLLNIGGSIGQNRFIKMLFYLFVPLLLILERTSWLINLGGLSFIIAEKR